MRDGWYRELILRFADGKEERFFIEMSRSGTFVLSDLQEPAAWTRLDFHQCSCCPLSVDKVPYCPAAESLENTLMRFRSHFSYEKVEATAVDGANRRTVLEGTLQEVGSIFVQLAVFSSGCPIGKRLRPLLRDIRPFATNNELTRHLIMKMLLKNRGNIEKAKEDIHIQLEPLHEVFNNLWRRLDTAPSGGDAVQNSIVRMDAFTMNVSLQVDEVLEELAADMGWSDAEDTPDPVAPLPDTGTSGKENGDTTRESFSRDDLLDYESQNGEAGSEQLSIWQRFLKWLGL